MKFHRPRPAAKNALATPPPPATHETVGFFASLFGQKTSPASRAAASSAPHPVAPPTPAPAGAGPLPGQEGAVVQPLAPAHDLDVPEMLATAREHLDKKDLPAALQLYERIANADTDLTAPFTTISGDLGATGNIDALIEFFAPRYDPAAHGLPPGINLLQAYLHKRDATAAQELLDLLAPLVTTYSMRDRMDGFRCAIAEIRAATPAEPPVAPPPEADVQLISISKPIWSYALPEGESLLPTKNPHSRRLGILPFALLGDGVPAKSFAPPDHPLAALVRGLPLVLAEVCWFAANYRPIATTGLAPDKNLLLSPLPFRGEQIRQLFPKEKEPLDYGIAGTIHAAPGGVIASLEFTIWDVRKTKLMKSLRFEGPDALARGWPQLLGFIEANKASTGAVPYTLPADPAAHAAALDHVLHFFLVEKSVLAAGKLAPHTTRLAALADYADTYHEAAAPRLALFAALHHCQALGLEVPPAVAAIAQRLSGA